MFGAAAALLLSTAACAPEPSWDTPDGLAFDDGKADGFAGTYRGVVFSLEEAKATLALANGATRDILDEQAGVGTRAATNIVGARPIATISQLSTIAQVGPASLTKLKQFATRWARTMPTGPQCGLGGKFDSVAFTPTEECRTLDIANTAGYLQLGQVDPAPRRTLYDRRPWRSLRDLANTYGIGSDVMQTLQAMSGEWVNGVSGHLDTVDFVLRTRPQVIDGRVPQVTIDRARVTGRVAGTPCLWLTDAKNATGAGVRIQLCAPTDFAGTETLFHRILDAQAVVQVRASYKLRSNGVPYLLAFATDYVRISTEPLP